MTLQAIVIDYMFLFRFTFSVYNTIYMYRLFSYDQQLYQSVIHLVDIVLVTL